LGALGFLALTGLLPVVTAVKLSAAQLAEGAAIKHSPKTMLASADIQCRVFMAVPLSVVVPFIIGKRSACAKGDSCRAGQPLR
jgi:hypothetical protein